MLVNGSLRVTLSSPVVGATVLVPNALGKARIGRISSRDAKQPKIATVSGKDLGKRNGKTVRSHSRMSITGGE
jgi:hypothetical protein